MVIVYLIYGFYVTHLEEEIENFSLSRIKIKRLPFYRQPSKTMNKLNTTICTTPRNYFINSSGICQMFLALFVKKLIFPAFISLEFSILLN